MCIHGEMQKAFILAFVGIILIAGGVVVIIEQPLIRMMKHLLIQNIVLSGKSVNYGMWTSPITLTFSCHLFNVTNPDEVMQGENPNFQEYGPISYDQVYEKQIISVDEENDEITFTMRSTYSFNAKKSINMTGKEQVTILNPAYIGSIFALSSLTPTFMKQYGNNMPYLFPNPKSIFLKAKPKDLLFSGVKIVCNEKKYPQLALICQTIKNNAPPILKPTEKEDNYLLSFFQRTNNTISGPYTINRGTRDISKVGDITSYKGKRIQRVWNAEECNRVRGTDSVLWAPILEPTQSVRTFIADACRYFNLTYATDEIQHGLTGLRYVLPESTWSYNASECFCPKVKQKLECLPKGLLDVYNCQDVPIYLSEPHFLHGDPQLLEFARGLKPNPEHHETFITIHSLTGSPLSGKKLSQMNMKLTKQPVDLLSNVSEGYFPLMWCGMGSTPELSLLRFTYQVQRTQQLLWFLQLVPLIMGIAILILSLIFCESPRRHVQPVNAFTDSVLQSSRLRTNNLTHRSLRKS